jgi:uncharacterized membrane protein (UPF0127 family)
MGHRAGELVLRREDDGQVLCERCVLADTLWRRMRGLLGRRELEPGEGIVLRPSWSVHTFFMRFAIDVVFVDADQIVSKVVGTLRPWRTATCRGARDVVELRAGECERLELTSGDRLAWAARTGLRPAARRQLTNGAGPDRAVSRNSRTRVLLGTGDDGFLRLARFLLARNHFDVQATKRLAKTVELVERHHSDVVVIDATGSLADAARTVAAMEAVHPDVGVVVVCDGEPPRWTTGLKVTEKWAALESLADDIRLLAEDARTRS